MNLVNTTPVPASILVSEIEGNPSRFGMVVAKATYRFDSSGPLDVDIIDPVPIFPGDVPTPVGLLPRDDLPRSDPAFEVIVLGHAYAPRGRATGQVRVHLGVGGESRDLVVFGDRVWQASGRIGPPVPFTQMPLTWDRAFGGSADILIDKDSPVTVADPTNRLGKGFDHTRAVEGLRQTFNPPEGYPRCDLHRPLPNLEDPAALIAKWEDAPRPVCWGTVPLDLGLHAVRSIDPVVPQDYPPDANIRPALFHRAHPDWVISLPPTGAVVVIDGLTHDGPVAFPIHKLRVLADWIIDKENGTSELVPQMLVILPDQQRYYLVFRSLVNVAFRPGIERSVRLRLAEGWYQPTPVRS
jgi:hypothetical protein